MGIVVLDKKLLLGTLQNLEFVILGRFKKAYYCYIEIFGGKKKNRTIHDTLQLDFIWYKVGLG